MIRIGVTFLLTGSTGVALRATEIALFQGAMGWALCLYFLLSALVLFVRAFMVYGRPAISRKPSRGMALNTPVLQLAPIRSRS